MNLKAISRNVGYALLVSALFMFFSIVVSVSNGNDSALAALLISFVITFTVGIFPFIFVRKTAQITLKDGYLIVVLSWLLSFIFGMLPYALWGGPFTVVNAWFESVSGFTTSGATILENIEALPDSLLFWRSSTHFIGGLGVVVFLLLIIPTASPVRLRLTNMELSALSKEGYNSRANKTIYIFAYVYIGICVAAFFSYWAAGMSPFDAICHAFSVCATGGFSTKNMSIAAFDSRLIEGLTMIFMYLASIHFGLIFMTIVTRSVRPLRNPVLRFYTGAIALFSILLAISLKVDAQVDSWGAALWHGTFNTLCVASTTGFGSIDNSSWSYVSSGILVFVALMCGCAGSTSGGVKADRVLLFFKLMGVRIRKSLYPSSVEEVRLGGQVVHDEDVYPQTHYITMYLFVIAISSILCLAVGVDPQNAVYASLTSMSNVGPAVGDLSAMGNFNAVPSAGKLIFSIDMFLGRVELAPVLSVVLMMFTGRKR